jgi:hypothetical protein
MDLKTVLMGTLGWFFGLLIIGVIANVCWKIIKMGWYLVEWI